MAAGNLSRGRRYRRRRPLPALLLIFVLAVVASVVWLKVLSSSDDQAAGATSCDPPHTPAAAVSGQPPTTLGRALTNDALDHTAPAAPAVAAVRVVNGSKQHGLSAKVTEALRQLGFSQVANPANDPLYDAEKSDPLTCRGQIRFGQQGMPTARTLSLIEPCVQLVKDDRQDASVDLALGDAFDDLRPRSEARTLLTELQTYLAQHPEVEGGLQADPTAQLKLDPALLTAARSVSC